MAALIIIIALVGCVVGGIISGLMPIVQSHKAAAMQRKEAEEAIYRQMRQDRIKEDKQRKKLSLLQEDLRSVQHQLELAYQVKHIQAQRTNYLQKNDESTLRKALTTEKQIAALKRREQSLKEKISLLGEDELEYRPYARGGAFSEIPSEEISCTEAVEPSLNDFTYKSDTTSPVDLHGIDGMEGHLFEHFCADLLRKNSFSNVYVTPGSGDQGVDILAEKGGVKYAVQCKNYASPLDNTSIQEVNAGRIFYNCHVGVVMTNSIFTPKAVDLAMATGVLLWDRNVLQEMIRGVNAETS